MACTLLCGFHRRLRLSHNSMDCLYEKMLDQIIILNYGADKVILNFITRFDQSLWGMGMVNEDICAFLLENPTHAKKIREIVSNALVALANESNFNTQEIQLINEYIEALNELVIA